MQEAEGQVGEAIRGSGTAFELLLSNNYKSSETPGLLRGVYTGIQFSSLERFCCIIPFSLYEP